MEHVKPLRINEDIINIKDLDYIDFLSDTFQVFAYLKLKKSINRDGDLVKTIDDVNEEIEKATNVEEWFADEKDYIQRLDVVKDIIKKYRYKL